MKCTWCSNDAITIGQAPTGTVGQTELPSCEAHKVVLEKLHYTPISETDFMKAVREQAKKARLST